MDEIKNLVARLALYNKLIGGVKPLQFPIKENSVRKAFDKLGQLTDTEILPGEIPMQLLYDCINLFQNASVRASSLVGFFDNTQTGSRMILKLLSLSVSVIAQFSAVFPEKVFRLLSEVDWMTHVANLQPILEESCGIYPLEYYFCLIISRIWPSFCQNNPDPLFSFDSFKPIMAWLLRMFCSMGKWQWKPREAGLLFWSFSLHTLSAIFRSIVGQVYQDPIEGAQALAIFHHAITYRPFISSLLSAFIYSPEVLSFKIHEHGLIPPLVIIQDSQAEALDVIQFILASAKDEQRGLTFLDFLLRWRISSDTAEPIQIDPDILKAYGSKKPSTELSTFFPKYVQYPYNDDIPRYGIKLMTHLVESCHRFSRQHSLVKIFGGDSSSWLKSILTQKVQKYADPSMKDLIMEILHFLQNLVRFSPRFGILLLAPPPEDSDGSSNLFTILNKIVETQYDEDSEPASMVLFGEIILLFALIWAEPLTASTISCFVTTKFWKLIIKGLKQHGNGRLGKMEVTEDMICEPETIAQISIAAYSLQIISHELLFWTTLDPEKSNSKKFKIIEPILDFVSSGSFLRYATLQDANMFFKSTLNPKLTRVQRLLVKSVGLFVHILTGMHGRLLSQFWIKPSPARISSHLDIGDPPASVQFILFLAANIHTHFAEGEPTKLHYLVPFCDELLNIMMTLLSYFSRLETKLDTNSGCFWRYPETLLLTDILVKTLLMAPSSFISSILDPITLCLSLTDTLLSFEPETNQKSLFVPAHALLTNINQLIPFLIDLLDSYDTSQSENIRSHSLFIKAIDTLTHSIQYGSHFEGFWSQWAPSLSTSNFLSHLIGDNLIHSLGSDRVTDPEICSGILLLFIQLSTNPHCFHSLLHCGLVSRFLVPETAKILGDSKFRNFKSLWFNVNLDLLKLFAALSSKKITDGTLSGNLSGMPRNSDSVNFDMRRGLGLRSGLDSTHPIVSFLTVHHSSLCSDIDWKNSHKRTPLFYTSTPDSIVDFFLCTEMLQQVIYLSEISANLGPKVHREWRLLQPQQYFAFHLLLKRVGIILAKGWPDSTYNQAKVIL